jgi:hypothetical protein
MKSPRAFGIALAALVFLGAGCSVQDAIQGWFEQLASKAVEKSAETGIRNAIGKDVKVDVTAQGASFTDPKTGRTFAVGESVTIPAGFPTDVPLYPKAVFTSVTMDTGGADAGYIFSTKDARAAVRDWYKDEASKQGWSSEAGFENADQVILSFSKPITGGTARMTVTIPPMNVHGETTVIVARKGSK